MIREVVKVGRVDRKMEGAECINLPLLPAKQKLAWLWTSSFQEGWELEACLGAPPGISLPSPGHPSPSTNTLEVT